MDGTFPQTPPMHPGMRNTLTLLSWAIQGLAHADRSRRERIAGIRPPLTGADAMHVYLKEHGIDVPHIDKVIKGLMQDGKTAGAVKELVTIAADAAANPHDLGAFVQHLARCCAPATGHPSAAVAGSVSPAAAPPGTTWTPASGDPPRFRPEFTSAARRRPAAPAPEPPTTETPKDTTPVTTAPSAVPANDRVPARNVAVADCVTVTSDAAGTAGCKDPIQNALSAEDRARLEALDRRMDAFETRIARELGELKDWMNAQFQELARRIDANGARQVRMQAEMDELRAHLRRVEAELQTLRAHISTKAPEVGPNRVDAEHDACASSGSVQRGEDLAEQTGNVDVRIGETSDGAGQVVVDNEPAHHEAREAEDNRDEAQASTVVGAPGGTDPKTAEAAQSAAVGAPQVAELSAKPNMSQAPTPASDRERIARVETRFDALEGTAIDAVGGLKNNMAKWMGDLAEKLGKEEAK
jgi:hypothetical protein